MADISNVIATNLIEIRKKHGLTQNEFAKLFNYSNKTISKWELGYAIPDVETLKEIADYYGVKVDYFLHRHDQNTKAKREAKTTGYRIAVLCLVNVFFILAATISYVAAISFAKLNIWPVFLYALTCCTFIDAYVTEKYWYKTICSYLFASLTIWLLLLAIYFSLITANIEYNFWYLFFLGLPIQVATIIILGLKHSNKKQSF